MEVKHLRTSKDEEFVKHLEDLIEKVKAGEVEECKIGVLLTKDAEKKKKHNVEDLSEEDCKKLLHAIFDEDEEGEEDVPVHPECNGDCESCENYIEDEEEDDPEEVFNDLANVIGCMAYYRLPISPPLMVKYSKAYMDKLMKDADNEDS